jgi:alpha-galactosidase
VSHFASAYFLPVIFPRFRSPLIISTDLSKASPQTLSILKNERIIALNVSPLSVSSGPLANPNASGSSKTRLESPSRSNVDIQTIMTFGLANWQMVLQLQVNRAFSNRMAFTHRNTVIINWQNSSRSVNFDLADVGFSSAIATNLISGHIVGLLKKS